MRWHAILPVAALLTAACGAIPADPSGTSDRVRGSGELRVGLASEATAARRLVAEVARTASARPVVREAPLEPLLMALDRGEIDLVVAHFSRKTPWKAQVALAPPIASTGHDNARIELRAALRNGENRWIMLVESASRRVAAEVQKP